MDVARERRRVVGRRRALVRPELTDRHSPTCLESGILYPMRFVGVLLATLVGIAAAIASLWIGFVALAVYRIGSSDLDAFGTLVLFGIWAGSTLLAVLCLRFVWRLNRRYSEHP